MAARNEGRVRAEVDALMRMLTVALPCAMVLSACAGPQPPAPDAATATEFASDYKPDLEGFDPGKPVESPALAPDEISLRILKLIDSVRGQQDLSPENVERVTGIKVHIDADDPDSYGFHGQAGVGWTYGLWSVPEPGPKPARQRLRFKFFPGQDQKDYSPICSPNYHDYANALVARGFQHEKVRAFVDEPWELLQFHRGQVTVEFTNQWGRDKARSIECVDHLFILTQ
jgi:hypothetical protein